MRPMSAFAGAMPEIAAEIRRFMPISELCVYEPDDITGDVVRAYTWTESGEETDLDPASQSLADALSVSFWILKAVMLLLVLAFLGWSRHSGFFTVPPQQQALVLRFGGVKGAGAPKPPGRHWSWPFPCLS